MKNNTNFYIRFRFEYTDNEYVNGTMFSLHDSLNINVPPLPSIINTKISVVNITDRGMYVKGFGKRITDTVYWLDVSPVEIISIQKELENLEELNAWKIKD